MLEVGVDMVERLLAREGEQRLPERDFAAVVNHQDCVASNTETQASPDGWRKLPT